VALLTSEKSQASSRRYVRFTDQHGRKHGVNVELRTGAPTGHWNFATAPITPPAHCLKISQDPDDPFKVFIDYDRIIREGREALDEYERAREKILFDKPDMKEIAIAHEIGRRPPPVEPWIAAKQGCQWTLGLSTRVNTKIYGILQEYAETRRRGVSDYDFTSEENYLSIEEEADPKATGGQRVPVRRGKNKSAAEDAAA
jgi:hypothetical protein